MMQPAFPVKNIEVRNPMDSNVEKEIFHNKLDKIINDKTKVESYRFADGEKLYMEKEMILRAKLSKIDSVTNNYFCDNVKYNTQSQVVKIKDISTFPKRNSRIGKQILSKGNPD